jgi:hypothetical protein
MKESQIETDLIICNSDSYLSNQTNIGLAKRQTGSILFYNASSLYDTTFQAGNATASATYTFPTAYPAGNNYYLKSSTAGTLAWDDASATYVTLATDQTISGVKTFSGQVVVKVGTAASPSVTFVGDLNTGIYEVDGSASDTVGISGGGTLLARFGGGNNQSAGDWIPSANNTYKLGVSASKWSEVWAVNGTIQTSSTKFKRNIQTVKYREVPKGIKFQWKDRIGRTDDFPIIGFEADGLPDECFPRNDNGTIDKSNVVTSSVIGILCDAVRDLQKKVARLGG